MQLITQLANRIRYVIPSRRRRREAEIAAECVAQGFELGDLREPIYFDPA